MQRHYPSGVNMNLRHIDLRDAQLRKRLYDETRPDQSHRPRSDPNSKVARRIKLDHRIDLNSQYDLTDFSGLPESPPVQTWQWVNLSDELDLTYTEPQYATRPKWKPHTEAELKARPPAYHAGNLLNVNFPPPNHTGPSKVVSMEITIGSDLLAELDRY